MKTILLDTGYWIALFSPEKEKEKQKDKRFNPLNQELIKLNLKCKAPYKFIPEIYKYSNIEDRYELIRGILDTDGSISSSGHIELKTSSKKLADTYEVSQRTIFRDLEVINAAGVPIVTFTGVNGGAEILKEFKIEKGFFNEKDLTHILLGLSSISVISDRELVNTISKIKSFIPKEKTKEVERKSSQISVDLKTWTGNKNLYQN